MQHSTLLQTPTLMYGWSQSCGNCAAIPHSLVFISTHFSTAFTVFTNVCHGKSDIEVRETNEVKKNKKLNSIIYQLQKTFLKVKGRRKGYQCSLDHQTIVQPNTSEFKHKQFSVDNLPRDKNKNNKITHFNDCTNQCLKSVYSSRYDHSEKILMQGNLQKENNFSFTYKENHFKNMQLYKMNSKPLIPAIIENKETGLHIPKLNREIITLEEDLCRHQVEDEDRPKRLNHKEQSVLVGLVDSVQSSKELTEVEDYVRQNTRPPFAVLRRLCAWGSKSNQVDMVRKLQKLLQKMYPDEYQQHLGFKYYLASALCYGGDVQEGLVELTQLYYDYPKGHKKIKDTTTFIIYHVLNSGNEEHEQMVINFINKIATELENLGPALTFWSISFSSSLYRHQLVAKELLHRHPALIGKMELKLNSMVERAAWDGNAELLYQILQLLLHYQLTEHYAAVTSTLLQLQCATGDLNGADETIKFAQHMGVLLMPAAVQRFLALLNHHQCPAPLSLLAMKYGRPPMKPSVKHPHRFKYKF